MNILITGNLDYIDTLVFQIKKELNDCEILFQKNEYEIYRQKDCAASDIDIVICNNFFSNNDIRNFKNLKYIQFLSSGLNNVNVGYLKKNNISYNRIENSYAQPIAEFVIFSILFFLKRTSFFLKNMHEKKWEKNRTLSDLSNKKIYILGYGNIAKKIVELLENYQSKLFVAVRNKENKIGDFREEINKIHFIDINKKSTIAGDADILISCLPLNEGTFHYIDFNFLSSMKNEAIIINVSRGEIIDENSLCHFLSENKFLGVYLDVFESEPLNSNSDLWSFDNMLITPHNSFVSENNSVRLVTEVIKKIKGYVKGL